MAEEIRTDSLGEVSAEARENTNAPSTSEPVHPTNTDVSTNNSGIKAPSPETDSRGLRCSEQMDRPDAELQKEPSADYGDLSDSETQLEVYAEELEGFARNGKGYRGLCPFHNDHEPSLRVDLKNGSWVWYCHPCQTGGNAFELLKRLGKAPQRKQKGSDDKKGEPTAVYDYTDANGQVLFQALRFGNGKGKNFRQRQPDGKGGWIWSVPEPVRTLYNLPEVSKAQQVFVVEGEKDVETARNLGFVATTNPMGAGKWLAKYSKLLAGKDIVIIPDTDQAGEKHCRVVFQSLGDCPDHPNSIRILRLPETKDLTEWMEAGGTAGQLRDLVNKTERSAYLDSSSGKFVVLRKREDDDSPRRTHFVEAWGNGKPDSKEGESRESFEYRAGQAAIKDIKQYGELCRTREGDLYFTTMHLPWKLVPLIDDDPRLIALMDRVFQVRPSTQAFKVILYTFQNEAFVNGKLIQVRQFSHADHVNKTCYLSLCDGQRMLKLTGTDEDTWDNLPVVPNGTDGVYFIDDASWEPWYPVREKHYVMDPETGEETEFEGYDRTVAKRLLVDTINFKDDILTADEQRWLMDKVLTTLLIDLPEKPLLALVGDNGSGKTFVGETIKTAFLGAAAGRAENISTAESLRVSLTSNPLVIVDNLDDVDRKQSAWLVKDLSVACTGTTIPLRRYYTTNQKVVLEPRSWVMATSTNTGFINNSPALGDRAIVFTLKRVDKGRFKERLELMRPILEKRGAILTDLALRLNDYVAAWRTSQLTSTDFRVASFGLAVSKMAEQGGELAKANEIFAKTVSKQNSVITDNHWLVEAIDRFIAGGNGSYKVNGEELLAIAKDAGFHALTVNKIHAEIESLNRVLTAKYDLKVSYPGNRKTYTFSKKASDQRDQNWQSGEPVVTESSSAIAIHEPATASAGSGDQKNGAATG